MIQIALLKHHSSEHAPHPLIFSIILAVLVHALLFATLRFNPTTFSTFTKPFEVHISSPILPKPTAQVMENNPPETNDNTKLQASKKLATTKTQVIKNNVSLKTESTYKADLIDLPTSNTSAPADNSTPKPHISAEQLLANAHHIVIEAAKSMPEGQAHHTPLSDKAFSTEIAQTLAPKKNQPAGDTQYASGMIKVVSASGNEYCLQPSQFPQDVTQSGSIPMTCP